MLTMNKKISVVIPLFNKGPYIARTLNSVLKQTFQDFEVIVVDDGSSDDGAEIVRGFDDPRIHLFQQENKGESAARNRGVDEALSDFVAFIDADDEWMPKHLETILRLIEKYPNAGMFATAFKRQTSDGKTQMAYYYGIPNPPWEGLILDFFKSGALGDFPVNSSVAVIPRRIFQEVGGFPEGYWLGPDIDLWGKIALKYLVAFSWEFGALYHLDDLGRVSTRMPPLDYQEPFIKTAHTALLKGEVPKNLIESLNEYIWRIESQRAINNLRAGYPEIAKDILKQFNTKWHYFQRLKWLLLAELPYPLYLCIRDIRREVIKMVRKKH